MNPVARALWFIESHFASEVTLADIARVAGVSRFHLVRAFGVTTGYSIMRYVRSRRLTEAARALADGAPDILMVALDAGYGSHEAFTRAFRDQFGVTPESVRAGGTVGNLLLVEAYTMDEKVKTILLPPRIETGRPLLIAGLGGHFSFDALGGIPALWQRFGPYLVHGQVSYGVCYNTDDAGNFDYIAGVEVAGPDAVPKEFATLRLSERLYAIFTHTEHISTLRGTFMAIFNDWLPNSGYKSADAPPFERYDDRFDARTGMGGFEVWIPIRPA